MNTETNLTQTELARRLGVDQSYLSRVLRHERRPSYDVARKLAHETYTHVLHWLSPDEFGPDGQPILAQPDEAQAHD